VLQLQLKVVQTVHCTERHYGQFLDWLEFIGGATPKIFGGPNLQRGSVVRTSVFNWQTFPDLRLIYMTCDHFVGKVSAMGQPNRPTQPSIPLGSVNE